VVSKPSFHDSHRSGTVGSSSEWRFAPQASCSQYVGTRDNSQAGQQSNLAPASAALLSSSVFLPLGKIFSLRSRPEERANLSGKGVTNFANSNSWIGLTFSQVDLWDGAGTPVPSAGPMAAGFKRAIH
jgi:hypothetical protein